MLGVATDRVLDTQLCFALYTAARATQNAYRAELDRLDLTYPQYLVLMVLWEQDGQTVSALSDHLRLDSGTLSPLLRRLEQRGVITRQRGAHDARRVSIHLTDDGRALKTSAMHIRSCLAERLDLSADELSTLHTLARRITHSLMPETTEERSTSAHSART
nr:MarR family transcriptional regulator [Devriesea agamarum]